MLKFIELDPAHSTTRRLRKAAPEVVEAELKAAQKPEDQFETILFQPEGEGRKGEGGLRINRYFKKNTEDKPLITVITVVFNDAAHLEKTILSVLSQSYDNVEYIIIDGGSTDGTLNIVQKYEHAIDYWVSENDQGIYDAMNKATKLSFGEAALFLNSGDCLLHSCVLEKIYQEYGFRDVLAGTAVWDKSRGRQRPQVWPYLGIMPNHQCMIFPRVRLGRTPYHLKYAIAGDLDLKIRLHKEMPVKLINFEITKCQEGGVSQNFKGFRSKKKMAKEIYTVIHHYYGKRASFLAFCRCLGSLLLPFAIKRFIFKLKNK